MLSSDEYQAIFEASPDGFLVVDRDGVIRHVHPGPEFPPSDDPAHASCDADYRALERALEEHSDGFHGELDCTLLPSATIAALFAGGNQ